MPENICTAIILPEYFIYDDDFARTKADYDAESGDYDDCYRALAQLGEALHHIREMEAVSLSNLY